MCSFLIDQCRTSEFFSYVHTYPNAHSGHDGLGIRFIETDYFLWGLLKNLVYATPLDSDEDLVARIFEAAARVREIPGIFERVL
ncbi:hypothetical protein TNCV_164241 [Trichonephila clavipes]|nr:hypothetical protein TNCV_164241 [Trichonephila clavipes]